MFLNYHGLKDAMSLTNLPLESNKEREHINFNYEWLGVTSHVD